METDIIQQLLTRGVEEVIEREHLEKRLRAGEKLRVKFGIDPTAAELHLGHAVPLLKLRQFQDLGHQVIFLIGDFTAMIGDPTGRLEMRKMLSKKEIKKNMKTYQEQAGKILDIKKVEVRYNSEWYDKLGPPFLFDITSKFTVARVLERDDFKKRIKDDVDISMLEILYPLLQGYDSVELNADVEIGGTDQKFNLLMGRKVQRRYGKPEQDIITVPLLEGTDGVHKMSKSLKNQISLTEKADNMYNKIMSIPDSIMIKYLRLLTNLDEKELEKIKKDITYTFINPRDVKMRLAYEIVKTYHSEKKAERAQENFVKIFQKKEIPKGIEEIRVKRGDKLADVLVQKNIISSKSEFRRLVKNKAVDVNRQTINDINYSIVQTIVVKIGKKKFIRMVI